MKKKIRTREDGFWNRNSFIESLSAEDMEEKMKTFHKKHDEDMNFNCRRCNNKRKRNGYIF